ncbi:SDR family oxidoreductase [Ornithinimicrobium faecis]|uniref:SDR family oxidoreductase n=1 Tax=Ornithinimicrobium faecis TaxID=2934158 RepID=A0ABY4YUT4_9MICO|nr:MULTISPECIES: SDR family oxidoreductase [unclassified Ornithinimicrobium]USQ80512.1 SDR family oxidoreductase [Ornithinimicrobium sp. HY1793]
MRGLSGRTAIVTGASRGIGYAIAERLIAEGVRVVITGRKQDALAEAVTTLGGPEVCLGVPGKADDPDHRVEAVAAAAQTFGPATLLVNNVGINPVYGPLMAADLGAARKIVEVNALAPLAWTQALFGAGVTEAAPAESGAVVNISSTAGQGTAPGIDLYGASKAMLDHLTRGLALELAPRVRVNAVAPALVRTRFAAPLMSQGEEVAATRYPLERIGIPDDIASTVAFLLSDEAAWITGTLHTIDGGARLR